MNGNSLEWQRLAEMDLATARHMFETYRPMPIEIVCFHSHQAVEKTLKCFLISKGIEAPRTHDLQTLMELCIDVEASLDNVYEEASLLTRYGVIPRYPTEIELIEQDAKTALEYADKVTEFVKKLLCKT